jgi:cysteine desulfurase family protein (TIGR01976 family)
MFDVHALREQFPSLNRIGPATARLPIFLDGPGGTQVPQRVIDAMVNYLTTCNANQGGVFTTSRESDAILQQSHEAAADLLNAASADEIIFGANMTSLTFHLSRAFGRTLRPGDEVLITRLDHDANVRPWVLAARDAGATTRFVDVHPEDCTLDLDDLRRQLTTHVRLVAVTCASNVVGSVNDVRLITRLAHEVGALVFLDAVHYAPHRLIDVRDWDCDFLACSAYKFYGPHVGILWGKREHLQSLPVYKLRPATDDLPGRWMTGTQNHEGLAGVAAAIDYLASIAPSTEVQSSRRQRLVQALQIIEDYERTLAERLLDGLASRSRFRVWGITRRELRGSRVPTIAITATDRTPQQVAEYLASREIYVWHGNMYALELTERLKLEESGGFVRLGLAHYNTFDEIDQVLQALDGLYAGR